MVSVRLKVYKNLHKINKQANELLLSSKRKYRKPHTKVIAFTLELFKLRL